MKCIAGVQLDKRWGTNAYRETLLYSSRRALACVKETEVLDKFSCVPKEMFGSFGRIQPWEKWTWGLILSAMVAMDIEECNVP